MTAWLAPAEAAAVAAIAINALDHNDPDAVNEALEIVLDLVPLNVKAAYLALAAAALLRPSKTITEQDHRA